jgi:hypothetical protein
MNQAPATTTTTAGSKALDEFLARVREPATGKGKLLFVLDATASRQETWDTAANLMAEMFQAAPSGLQTQLVYYRGAGECHASKWFNDAKAMTQTMTGIFCRSGLTQIRKVLLHAAKEHAKQKIATVILVSDACEEHPNELYAAARELGVPVFMFQEGDDEYVASIYMKIAEITKGAYCKFDSGAAARLADLLKAVAAFASGGLTALANQNSEAAKLLLTQIKK